MFLRCAAEPSVERLFDSIGCPWSWQGEVVGCHREAELSSTCSSFRRPLTTATELRIHASSMRLRNASLPRLVKFHSLLKSSPFQFHRRRFAFQESPLRLLHCQQTGILYSSILTFLKPCKDRPPERSEVLLGSTPLSVRSPPRTA